MKGLVAVVALLAGSMTSAPAAVPAPKATPAAATAAAPKPASKPAPAAAVSFSRDIVPLLRTQCATCHMTGMEPGNMALHPGAAYANLVNVKSPVSGLFRVVPGKPEQSYLLMKLEGTHLDHGGKGVRMPFGVPPLPQKVIDQIAAWISQGAKNN